MRCPKCRSPKTLVIDSRPQDGKTWIFRRRRCDICKYTFATMEIQYSPLILAKMNTEATE